MPNWGLVTAETGQYQLKSEKNIPNGYAGLTGSTKIDVTHMPINGL